MNTDFGSSNTTFRCVADALGLGYISDGVTGMDPILLIAIYRHARNEDGNRVLFERNQTFTKGWVNLDSQSAKALISAFVPLDDPANAKYARQNAQTNLEAQPWNDLLGIEDPPIVCRIKIHGHHWGLRFQSAEPALKGREILNEQLPAVPAERTTIGNVGIDETLPHPRQKENHQHAEIESVEAVISAADVLRKAGMPT